MTDSMAGMTTSTLIVKEVTQALAENYLGIGSTPESAIVSLTDDLINNRLNAKSASEWGATQDELLMAIGTLLLEMMDRALSA